MTSLKSRYHLKKQKLHTFDDVSGQGVAATVIAVIQQQSGTSQGLVAIGQEKPNYTSPGTGFYNMGTNLVHNVREVLVGFTVNQVFGWLDSTVALLWVCRGGDFKQFVGNRVCKIQKRYIQWNHVPTQENPVNLGSRGGKVSDTDRLWWEGPEWLTIKENWPADIVTSWGKESTAETQTD